jgi:hypothetical protein
MEWFSRTTSMAGTAIPNWVLALAAVVVIWIIYRLFALGSTGISATSNPHVESPALRMLFPTTLLRQEYFFTGLGIPQPAQGPIRGKRVDNRRSASPVNCEQVSGKGAGSLIIAAADLPIEM